MTSSIPVDIFIDDISSGDIITGTVQSLGIGYFLSSKSSHFAQQLKVLPQASNVEYSYVPDEETVTLTCSPANAGENHVYQLGFIGTSMLAPASILSKVATKNADGKFVATFSTAEIRMPGGSMQTWKAFAQTALTDNSTSQLPSPHLFLKESGHILFTPNIKAIKLNSKFSGLGVTVLRVQNASNYQVKCSLYDSSSTTLKVISKTFQPSDEAEVLMEIEFNNEIPQWDSVLPSVNMINVTVTAGGTGYCLTSNSSNTEKIRKQSPPIDLMYSYSSTDDTATVSCKRQCKKIALGVMDAKSASNRFFEVVDVQENIAGPIKFKIAGQKLRDVSKEGQEWIVFAQAIGNVVGLPSEVVKLSDPIKILREPENVSTDYDESSTILTMSWPGGKEPTSYRVLVYIKTFHGSQTLIFDEDSKETKLAVNCSQHTANWESLIRSTTSFHMIITIMSLGSGTFINSNENRLTMDRTLPLREISFSIMDAALLISWKNTELDARYTISCFGEYGTVTRSVDRVSQCVIQKISLLRLSGQAYHRPIEVSITSKKKGYLPSSPISKTVNIKSPIVVESRVFGRDFGKSFNDFNNDLEMVGMTSLVIHHDASINSLQALYYLQDGSVYTGPLHGSQTGQKTILNFGEQDSIIAVSAFSSSTTKLSQFIIVIQHADGQYKKCGPYGTAQPYHPEEQIKFLGNVLAIKGKCDANFIYALGFKFTHVYPSIYSSRLLGGGGGSLFDDKILMHVPRIVAIKGINITARSDHITRIQFIYLMDDDKVWEAPIYGYEIDNTVELKFEAGESVIQVKGGKFYINYGSRILVFKQISFKTQKKDGTIMWYGPFGGEGESEGDTLTVTGTLKGIYGFSGGLIDSMGMYYSVERSELFGGAGGGAFDVHSIEEIAGIKELKVEASSKIVSLQVIYYNTAGRTLDAVKYGGRIDDRITVHSVTTIDQIEFEEDEDIVQMKINTYIDQTLEDPSYIIGKMQITTQKKDGTMKQYGPYGTEGTKEFTLNGRVVAFFGRSGWFLDAIGMYYIPI